MEKLLSFMEPGQHRKRQYINLDKLVTGRKYRNSIEVYKDENTHFLKNGFLSFRPVSKCRLQRNNKTKQLKKVKKIKRGG